MKKLLALLLALMMLFSVATVFAGCEDSGKKKNSSSSKDDDEDEEDEEDEDKDKDEDEDEDKDGEDKDDENKGTVDEEKDNDKDDESEKPAPKPTEGKLPDPEPVEPEDELLDSPYEEHDTNIDLYICAQFLNEGQYQYFEIAKQKTSKNEGLIYYSFGTGELMMEIMDDSMNLYVPDGSGNFVLDTETDDQSKMKLLETVSNLFVMFVDFDTLLGEGVQYKLLGTDNGCSVYEAYSNGSLVRTFYVDQETGVTMYVADQNGNDLIWVEELYLDFDLAQLLP